MEVLVYMLFTLGLFFLGLSLGALLENKRIRLVDRLDNLEKTTQEILLPLASKVEHMNARRQEPSLSTWTGYKQEDPDETMKIPTLHKREKDGEGKETW